MDIRPVPLRPPGMNDTTYAEIMKRKRRAATRNGIILGGLALSFFLFPLVFTTWKNKQGANGMLVNKVATSPGQGSEPLFKFEQKHGHFSDYVNHHSEAQHASANSANSPQITPQEQYAQFKAQKNQVVQQQRSD